MTKPTHHPDDSTSHGQGWLDRTAHRRRSHFARRPSKRERSREALLTDWYGSERSTAEIGALRSAPREVGDVLDDILADIGLGERVVLDKVKELWPDLVGADIARCSEPLALRDRVVTVEVASPTMRYVLKGEHYHAIRQKLRELTDDKVCDVRFVPPGRLGAFKDRRQE